MTEKKQYTEQEFLDIISHVMIVEIVEEHKNDFHVSEKGSLLNAKKAGIIKKTSKEKFEEYYDIYIEGKSIFDCTLFYKLAKDAIEEAESRNKNDR